MRHKILHGVYDKRSSGGLLILDESTRRGNDLKLKKPSHELYGKGKIRRNFFTNRVTDKWNALPNSVVLAKDVNAFKNALDSHWKETHDIYEGA